MQRVPQNAVLEDQGRVTKIKKLGAYAQNSPEHNLSSPTGEFNTFSEESKKTMQSLRKIELFELGVVSTRIQGPSCAKYWPKGLFLCCICDKCLGISQE